MGRGGSSDGFTGIERPHARPDLRGRRIRGPRDEGAIVAMDVDGVSALRLAFDRGDRTGENPRMKVEDGFFLAGFES